jgi:Ni/Co efflux regulator RcnB
MPYKRQADPDEDEDVPLPPRRHQESVAPNQQKSEYDPKKARAPLSEPIGGPVTANYSEFIQKIFSPANHIRRSATALADYSDMAYTNEIPASLQLKVEMMEAAAELGTKRSDTKLFSPLESMCDTYSRMGLEDKPYAKYDVYEPKSNAEWFSVANRRPQATDTPSIHYKTAKTAASPNQWNYKPPYESTTSRTSSQDTKRFSTRTTPKHYVIDYSNFRSAPLSPYMYRGHEYVKRHDSRIVGSDFVMLTLRPKDDFLKKIDKTLADARKINSWSM